MQYHKQAHAVYCCEYHIVFPTKYRKKLLNEGTFAYLELKLKEVGKYYPEIQIMEMNHDEDHIHLLVSIPPKMSVGSVVRVLKANTSRAMKQKFTFIKEAYWGTDGMWSDGYFVSTVGRNEEAIRKYIESQGQEDSGQAMLELG